MKHSYQANFSSFLSGEDVRNPDIFYSHDNKRPVDTFVISRDSNGSTKSIYSDDIWDLRGYRLAGDSGSAKIDFSFARLSQRHEAKWMTFLLIYIVEGDTSFGISIPTIMDYVKVFRRLFRYSDNEGLIIGEILSNEYELKRFINNIETKGLLSSFSSILGHFIRIPSEISGYRITSSYYKYFSLDRAKSYPASLQHPVIPPRILSSLIDELDYFLDLVSKYIDRICDFSSQIITDPLFARCEAKQRQYGVLKSNMQPFFQDASAIYGLEEIFSKFGIRNIPSLSKFITRIQHACRIYIHIYTGMRNSEVLSLAVDSLKISGMGTGRTYKFIGFTSKFVGQKKKVSWVTSKNVVLAFDVANRIASLILSHADISSSEKPLFISIKYLKLTGPSPDSDEPIVLARSGSKAQEIFNYFDESKFIISNHDFEHLCNVDPFRSWSDEKLFKIGSVWRFTTHQFRRTLAFYISQSSNVSLPALKSQLKHLTREMSLYYCSGSPLSKDFDHMDHFSHFLIKAKPEADTIAYAGLLDDTTEPLFGAYGRFINRNDANNNFCSLDRDDLEKSFKKGEIAYKETPLGACMTTSPCDKKLLRLVSACISCDKAIIKPSKLERVITRQRIFVDELKSNDDSSIALRTELSELEDLESYQRRIALLRNKGG